MNFNERLKQLRLDANATLKVVSAAIRIPLSTYSNYEQGIREPSFEILRRICDYFDVSADYLIGRVDY